MKIIDTNATYFIGGSPRHPIKYGSRSVGGRASLPPWSKEGKTYGQWIKTHPVGNNPSRIKLEGGTPRIDMKKYIA